MYSDQCDIYHVMEGIEFVLYCIVLYLIVFDGVVSNCPMYYDLLRSIMLLKLRYCEDVNMPIKFYSDAYFLGLGVL